MSKLLSRLSARLEATRDPRIVKFRDERKREAQRKEAEFQALLKVVAWTEFWIEYELRKAKLKKLGLVEANGNVIPRIVARQIERS